MQHTDPHNVNVFCPIPLLDRDYVPGYGVYAIPTLVKIFRQKQINQYQRIYHESHVSYIRHMDAKQAIVSKTIYKIQYEELYRLAAVVKYESAFLKNGMQSYLEQILLYINSDYGMSKCKHCYSNMQAWTLMLHISLFC